MYGVCSTPLGDEQLWSNFVIVNFLMLTKYTTLVLRILGHQARAALIKLIEVRLIILMLLSLVTFTLKTVQKRFLGQRYLQLGTMQLLPIEFT